VIPGPLTACFINPRAHLDFTITKMFIVITRICAFDVEPSCLIVHLQHTEDDVREGRKFHPYRATRSAL
jgi:hypothetical protein